MEKLRALSIQQPHAERILLGKKTEEKRGFKTNIVGERFYIYASKKVNEVACAEYGLTAASLPTGVLVGTAVIEKCMKRGDKYHWQLTDVQRLPKPKRCKRRANAIWFYPF